jgi:hypothetical protein
MKNTYGVPVAICLGWPSPVILIVAFVLAGLPLFTQGQDLAAAEPPLKQKNSFWFDLGVGWGGQGTALNLGASLQVKPKSFVTLRYADVSTNEYCNEIALFIPISNPLGRTAESLEFSYGALKKGRHHIMTMSVGLAYVNIKDAGGDEDPVGGSGGIFYYSYCPADYHVESTKTMGLVLQGQFIPCARWGGIGINPYININPEYVFAALTINMAFGRLRQKNVPR